MTLSKMTAAVCWLTVLVCLASSPSPGQSSGRPLQNGLLATIPFARDAEAMIYLPVRLNGGREQWWVLDTGASECLIDRSVARQMSLVTRGRRDLRGTGSGSVRMDSIRSTVRLSVANQPLFSCDHFGSVDLRNATGGARAIAGILGYEFFARYIVRIDFRSHTLQLYDPAIYRYAGKGDTVALQFDRRQPRVAVRIRTAKRPEVIRKLIVDTGSEDAVDDSTVRRNPNGSAVTVPTTGLGTSYSAALGTLDTVIIGRLVFTDVPGVASNVGIVGNGIWKRFISTFDYPHKRLFLERL